MNNKYVPPNQQKPIIDKLESSRINQPNTLAKKIFVLPHKKEVVLKPQASALKDKSIFGGKSEISLTQIYQNLVKDPEFAKQAAKEGKKPWELAKELVGKFQKSFGGLISKSEAKKQINYYDYWKTIHEQKEIKTSAQKSKKIEQEKQERNLLKKKFDV